MSNNLLALMNETPHGGPEQVALKPPVAVQDRPHTRDQIHLPNEILQQIIQALAPENSKGLMPAHDVRTKTLLSATLTCKALYPIAAEVIRNHCVFLDSFNRMTRFHGSCSRSPPSFIKDDPSRGPSVKIGLRSTPNMFLRPFPMDRESGDVEQRDGSVTSTLAERRESNMIERFFAGFPNPQARSSVNCMRLILDVCGDSLRRLVLDLPLKYIVPVQADPEVHDQIIRSLLRLRKLKEFITLQDERYFRAFPQWPEVDPPANWSRIWPCLYPLMYYNPLPDRHADIWMDMNHVPHLELAVFIGYGGRSSDGLDGKEAWLERACTAEEPHVSQDGTLVSASRFRNRNLTLVCVDLELALDFKTCPLNWETIEPSGRVRSLSARRVELRPDGSGNPQQVNAIRNFPWQVWDQKFAFPLTDSVVTPDAIAVNYFIRWSIWTKYF